MSPSKQPPAVSGRMCLQVRTVDGRSTVLSLPATDHRIVSGETSNYLVGFGTVHGFDGDRLPAPPLPGTPLRPRGRVR